MKKKVAFQKEIEFPTMIGEVSAISLEHNLKFIDESNVEGDLLLTGKYKLTEASRLEEEFNYKLPMEITLTEKVQQETAKVEITDFYYEIENEDTMICNVELLVEGVEVIELEEDLVRNVDRECDGDSIFNKEIELPKIEKEEMLDEVKLPDEETLIKQENMGDKEITMKEEVKEKIEVSEEVNSLFFGLGEEKETYGTFLVYMVRQNESINSIIEKYKTSIEEIEKYNNLNDLNIGTKLIIPILND